MVALRRPAIAGPAWSSPLPSDCQCTLLPISGRPRLRLGHIGQDGHCTARRSLNRQHRRAAELFQARTGWTLHQLRHSALTHAAEDGTNLPLLLARSRHASVRSLERYAAPAPRRSPATSPRPIRHAADHDSPGSHLEDGRCVRRSQCGSGRGDRVSLPMTRRSGQVLTALHAMPSASIHAVHGGLARRPQPDPNIAVKPRGLGPAACTGAARGHLWANRHLPRTVPLSCEPSAVGIKVCRTRTPRTQVRRRAAGRPARPPGPR
jgi:hypothetical protein